MKRRSFLTSILGFLGIPFLPRQEEVMVQGVPIVWKPRKPEVEYKIRFGECEHPFVIQDFGGGEFVVWCGGYELPEVVSFDDSSLPSSFGWRCFRCHRKEFLAEAVFRERAVPLNGESLLQIGWMLTSEPAWA